MEPTNETLEPSRLAKALFFALYFGAMVALLEGMLRSRTVSTLIIAALHPNPKRPSFNGADAGAPPIAPWYEPPDQANHERPATFNSIPVNEIAFVHNLNSVIDAADSGGTQVVLVPVRPAPDVDIDYLESVQYHEELLRAVAKDRNLPLAPFPAEAFSPENWVDDFHVNEAGSREKALHIEEYVRAALATR